MAVTKRNSTDAEPPPSTERTALLGESTPPETSDADAHLEQQCEDDVANVPVTRLRGLAIGLSLGLLIFLQATNMSGMTMIQGQIADDIDAHAQAIWFTTAYLIPLSSLAPVAGRLATIFSPRTLVLPIAISFSIGSLVTSRATSFWPLAAGRAIAGLGGAGVLSLCIIFTLELTSKKRRGLFIGLVNSGFTSGVASGAVVYGALLPVVGWRPIFLWQVPIGIVAGAGVYFSLPSNMQPGGGGTLYKPGSVRQKLARIDYLGAFLLALTIVIFLYALAADIHPTMLLLSLASLLAFLFTEYRIAADPIIPLMVLSSRGVLLSCAAQLCLMTARWTVLFYSPIFMLAVRGAAPATAGSILIPTNAGFGIGGFLVGWLHIRRNGSFWLPCVIVMAFFSASLFVLGLVAFPTSRIEAIIAIVFVNGLATGAALNYTLAHVLHLSHKDTEYVTTSLLGTFRGFGGSFGTSVGGGIFFRLLRDSLTKGYMALDGSEELSPSRLRMVSRLLGNPAMVFSGSLEPEEQKVAIDGYAGATSGVWHAAAILAVVVIFIQAATSWTAPPNETKSWDEEEEEQARAAMLENEGVAEA